ncbi:MAG: hypothetical protein ACOYL3_00030 [Desulfuromonadaceae bacterium]
MAIFLNIIAKTMNAGGCALVSAFDAGAAAFNCTMSALSPGERTKLGNRIKELERKIHALTSGIAKETSKYADPAAALESETVKALLSAVKELHKEIEPLKQRIAEIDVLKGVKKPQQESAGLSSCIAQSITGLLPGEKAGLQKKIFANEKKIQSLYTEFAREVAKQPDPYEAIHSKVVAAINAKINELNAENSALKLQIADLAKPKAEKPKPEKPKSAEKKAQPDVKKPQPDSSGVAKFFIHAITDSISGYLPGEKSTIDRKLSECDKKIQSLYLDIAKESTKYPDPADAVTAAPVVALVAKINELKAEVATLNQRKAELSGVGKAKAAAAVAKTAATPAKVEPTVVEEVPAVSPVLPETDEVVDTSAVPVTESDAVAETAAHEESESSELPEAESCAAIDAPAEATEQTESDPSEGTPYVNSRTKSCDIAEPVLQPPTEEDIKAVVREIQAEEALSEQINEEVAASLDEPSPTAEPAAEEEQNEASDDAVEEELAVAADVAAEAVTVTEEVTGVVTEEVTESVAEETEKEADDLSTSFDAVVEHPPFVPVPEAEEVFGLQETDAVTVAVDEAPQETDEDSVAAADEVPQEAVSEVAADEADAGETEAPAPQEESEIAPEAAAGTTSEEVAVPAAVPAAVEHLSVATSARADAFGVVTDYSPAVPVSRPETTIKEESGSGFRTRLFRNQFSILTPVPTETSSSNLEPPTREDIETVARGMQADDVEKYKLNEILEEHAVEVGTAPDTEEVSETETAETEVEKTEVEEAEETEVEETAGEDTGESDAEESDVPDYFKKLSERRNAILSGEKGASTASGKSSPRKRR